MSALQSTDELGPFEGLHGEPGVSSVFTCALCGGRFTHGEKVCGSCPLNRGCEVVRCPNCGYQFPRESVIVRWVTRLLRRK
jgi:hypothetical protein